MGAEGSRMVWSGPEGQVGSRGDWWPRGVRRGPWVLRDPEGYTKYLEYPRIAKGVLTQGVRTLMRFIMVIWWFNTVLQQSKTLSNKTKFIGHFVLEVQEHMRTHTLVRTNLITKHWSKTTAMKLKKVFALFDKHSQHYLLAMICKNLLEQHLRYTRKMGRLMEG